MPPGLLVAGVLGHRPQVAEADQELRELGVVLDPVQQAHPVGAQVDVGDEVHRHALRDGPDLDVAALVHEPQLVPERLEQRDQQVGLKPVGMVT